MLGQAVLQAAERGRERRQVGGGVVKQRRESAGSPEEDCRCPDRTDDKAERSAIAHSQHREDGDHGHEDTREQDRHLADGLPGMVVLLPELRRGGKPRPRCHEEHDPVADQPFDASLHPEDRYGAGAPVSRENDGGENAHEERQVVPAFDADGLARSLGIVADVCLLSAPVPGVHREIGRDQARDDQGHLPPKTQGPEERHSVEEAEEQGRVAKRRECSADVRHEEDEKDHRMGPVAAAPVRAQERPDEEDGGSGRTDPGREGGAHDNDHCVHRRGTSKGTPDQDAATDRVEGPEE